MDFDIIILMEGVGEMSISSLPLLPCQYPQGTEGETSTYTGDDNEREGVKPGVMAVVTVMSIRSSLTVTAISLSLSPLSAAV